MTQVIRSRRSRENAPDPVKDAVTISESFVSENPDHHFVIETVDVTKLEIDTRMQRGVVENQVTKILKRFNPAALNTIVVSAREDADPHGTRAYRYFILDGQQRWTAVTRRGGPAALQAVVHYGLSLAEEARLFIDLNERDAVSPWDRFKAACVAEDPQALEIQELLEELRIPLGPPKGFSAIAKAERIYSTGTTGPADLRWALTLLRDTFDHEGKGGCYDGRVIGAFAFLYREFKAQIDTERMRKMLHLDGVDTHELVGRGIVNNRIYGGKPEVCIAEAIIAIYNKKTRKGGKTTEALPSVLMDRAPGRKAKEQLAHMGAIDGDALLESSDDDE